MTERDFSEYSGIYVDIGPDESKRPNRKTMDLLVAIYTAGMKYPWVSDAIRRRMYDYHGAINHYTALTYPLHYFQVPIAREKTPLLSEEKLHRIRNQILLFVDSMVRQEILPGDFIEMIDVDLKVDVDDFITYTSLEKCGIPSSTVIQVVDFDPTKRQYELDGHEYDYIPTAFFKLKTKYADHLRMKAGLRPF